MSRLFVYGTLMSVHSEHVRVAPYVVSVSSARTTGRLFDLPEGYPALMDGPEEWVFGELLELDSGMAFDALDAYEGIVPGDSEALYTRVQKTVWVESRAVTAWCYLVQVPEAVLVRQGGRRLSKGQWKPRNQKR